MSLLMDALKKAEQAKRQGQAEEAAEDSPGGKFPSLSLEPLELEPAPPLETPPRATTAALPELPSQLDVLDAEFMDDIRRPVAARPVAAEYAPMQEKAVTAGRPEPSPAATAPPQAGKRPPAAEAAGERETAKNLFEAKQPPSGKNKAFAITIGVATLIAAIGIGVYFWMQLKPSGGLMPAIQPPPPRPLTAAPPPSPTPASPPPAEPAPATGAEATATPEPPPVAKGVAAAKPVSEIMANAAPRPAAPPVPDTPIRITKTRLANNPALMQSYDFLGVGDLDGAQAGYGQVLKAEPKNPDALHGMAAVAIRRGQFDRAEEYYLRAIEADPKDAIAQAGMIGLRGQADPVSSESRLKSLIAAQPEQHFLHFALGNVYAAAGRWNEAQQAFFKAYSGDPDHPDYLFNLAVSLDHLRQPRLAAQYYNQALLAANGRTANFDKAQAVTRLRELQP